MKTIKLSMLALALGLMSFSAAEPIAVLVEKTASTVASISWKSETIDVGEIPQNKPKEINFEFKNTGKTTVIITNVQGSCGCTATAYTKTPILPGTTGTVTATYNAANVGAFSKTVTVTTNATETPSVLTLRGVVKPAVIQG
ncbi:DUF1573 domain-containing protein [Flavobacterium muglaense]|uniref:DUF1573 domain-containing protein n=1 Tax=Flavobacterium muglaense TaxID=2764716 RepID=A0A923MWW4_9FLAO|nr:DUF1573 domain-containing protein [Flavobacterium muglaense]MBC5836575.1 DUF1573 domain-containing protein [Flavobacterium muglaense]MBC5843159.1 DUF1573 domain-containing protein [Flavobacterium muglaense]